MPTQSALRAFVRRHTQLRDVPGLPGIRLHQGDDVMTLMQLTGRELGNADPPLPFWAFAWAGGLAVARFVREHPEAVAGRSVLDLATGSGLCGLVALQAGAASVLAVDIDPFAEAAIGLNAKANGLDVDFSHRDILGDPPPRVDVVLAGDVCYEETMADRMIGWLRLAASNGSLVLLGDPGRRYLPAGLELVASYRVRTSRELEPEDVRDSAVYAISAVQPVG